MHSYQHPDWVRLGRAVYSARSRSGYGDMTIWADRVGRSTRMLLGLERGERVGRGTLEAIEAALEWPTGHSHAVLSGAVVTAFPVSAAGPSAELAALTDDQLIAELSARLASRTRRGTDGTVSPIQWRRGQDNADMDPAEYPEGAAARTGEVEVDPDPT